MPPKSTLTALAFSYAPLALGGVMEKRLDNGLELTPHMGWSGWVNDCWSLFRSRLVLTIYSRTSPSAILPRLNTLSVLPINFCLSASRISDMSMSISTIAGRSRSETPTVI